MDSDRRSFLKRFATAAAALTVTPMGAAVASAAPAAADTPPVAVRLAHPYLWALRLEMQPPNQTPDLNLIGRLTNANEEDE